MHHSLPIFEAVCESDRDYASPVHDVTVRLEFTSPAGRRGMVEAFWDGGRTWRARIPVADQGSWSYRIISTDAANTGLHGREGRFEARPNPARDQALYRNGPIRLSDNRRHFAHADGTPWLWVADTAWNGVLKARPEDWERYLTKRREQGFTAVQFVTSQWRAFAADAQGETAFTGTERIHINPRFYQRLDDKIAAINRHGLVAAPVLLWACTPNDPGSYLQEEDALLLARYLVARYGAYNVIWILGGDGDYRGEKAERWLRIGQALFGNGSDRLATMHPGGQHWVADEFRSAPWFDFVSYQSGHGDSDEHVRWLVQGPPAQEWRREPARPVINQEPNYEAHLAYHSKQPVSPQMVRRSLYWSLLLAPAAGVTYGHHSIWPWMEERGVPMDHPRTGEAPPWPEALQSEGAASVAHLVSFMGSLPWWVLRPAPEILSEQPGEFDPKRFVGAARAEDGSHAVLYLPAGGSITLNLHHLNVQAARWFNPRTGVWTAAGPVQGPEFAAPDANDWLLWLGPA